MRSRPLGRPTSSRNQREQPGTNTTQARTPSSPIAIPPPTLLPVLPSETRYPPAPPIAATVRITCHFLLPNRAFCFATRPVGTATGGWRTVLLSRPIGRASCGWFVWVFPFVTGGVLTSCARPAPSGSDLDSVATVSAKRPSAEHNPPRARARVMAMARIIGLTKPPRYPSSWRSLFATSATFWSRTAVPQTTRRGAPRRATPNGPRHERISNRAGQDRCEDRVEAFRRPASGAEHGVHEVFPAAHARPRRTPTTYRIRRAENEQHDCWRPDVDGSPTSCPSRSSPRDHDSSERRQTIVGDAHHRSEDHRKQCSAYERNVCPRWSIESNMGCFGPMVAPVRSALLARLLVV